MKTRILFVDDEPLALQGLQRLLRSMREGWDMAFAENGAQALEWMARSRFDLVVSDMRMTAMTGAQLLNEVRQRHPQTARLILSGHADKELILQCVGSAHQYLAKPCPPDTLKARLGRVVEANRLLQNHDELRQSVCQMDRFPSVPSLYIEVVELLLMPEVQLQDVAQVVGQDIGLSAALMKLVNSAFFGPAKEVSNAAEALAALGLETLKALVFSVNAFSQFDVTIFRQRSLDVLWKHNLATGIAAKRIALAENADPRMADQAFAAGLFHDAGKFLLGSHFDKLYEHAERLAQKQKSELWRAERDVFGVSHVEAGACLLGLWGLPAPVVEAVHHHHAPQRSAAKTFCPLAAVHAANALLRERDPAGDGVLSSRLDRDFLAQLGLLDKVEAWRSLLREPANPN